MARHFVRSSFACAIATFAMLAGGSLAGDTGYWNVPSTMCQWMGCGFGGGYHAPLILGPPTYECMNAPNEVRLPYAPNPYGCAPCYHSGGYGHNARGMQMLVQEPVVMAPAELPMPVAQPAADPAGMQPIFAPPVQP